ncbi:MAG: tyrosine-protein phosphatase [Chloroflexi bacterium]|nr:tyrosine-protein phosphatase [Chloroflexota bacterium]
MYDEISIGRDFAQTQKPNHARRLSFLGAKNFRDLGGYQAADGRSVRWGMLYRSDKLHNLTDADLARLSALGLDRVIDFRTARELAEEPDRLPASGATRAVHIPINDPSTVIWYEEHDEFLKNIQNVNPGRYLTQTNVELVTRFTPEVQRFVREVFAAHGNPVLFHCAAGKDRTGFAAALLLRILGVPMKTILEDYLLTNQYYLPSKTWELLRLRLLKGGLYADVVRGFMEVQPAYLQAAFDTMEREHGSFEGYLQNALGLSEHEIEHLRAVYLE